MEQHIFHLKDTEFAPHREAMRKATYVGKDLMLIHWIIEPTNTRTPIHWHDANEQSAVTLQGRAELTVGEERVILGPGDVYWAPQNLPHGQTLVLGDEPLHILDVFSPPRADYLPEPKAEVGAGSAKAIDGITN